MKRKLALLVAGVMVVGMFAGCGSSASSDSSSDSSSESTDDSSSDSAAADGDVVLGYSCVDMNNTFQTYLVAAAQDKAEELGASITVTDAQNDVVKQQDQVKALIQQGVDALIVVIADSSAAEPVTQAAQDAGIPLVYVNTLPQGFEEGSLPDGVHYVGSYEHDAGVMQGEMIGEAIGSGKVAILQGGLEYEATYNRSQGNKDEFEENYPDIEVVTEETANWQRDKAIDVVNNWLTAYDDLAAICANNDEMALGAIQALQAAGKDIPVVGVDATVDGCAAVKDGSMLGTVFQDSVGQGGGAVEIAVNWVKGEEPESDITWVPYVKVTADNVDDYM